mgnify:CR=1 FL=1
MSEEFWKTYESTIKARNFHYDNFSKWMTYYYVAVAAVFVAFYNYKCNDKISVFIICLGCFISTLWHLSCKGYYYWIKNWTQLINRLEDKIEKDDEKVYSIFAKHVKENDDSLMNPIQSANISTSKVTLILSFGICSFWFYVLVDKLTTQYCNIQICCCFEFIFAAILTLTSILVFGQFLKSNISQHKFV